MSLLTKKCNRRKEKEEKEGGGAGDAPYSPFSSRPKCNLFTLPPPKKKKNMWPLSSISIGSTVIPRRNWKQWSCKILGLKKVPYGFGGNGEKKVIICT